jgi:hypothetical protein
MFPVSHELVRPGTPAVPFLEFIGIGLKVKNNEACADIRTMSIYT